MHASRMQPLFYCIEGPWHVTDLFGCASGLLTAVARQAGLKELQLPLIKTTHPDTPLSLAPLANLGGSLKLLVLHGLQAVDVNHAVTTLPKCIIQMQA
jgi:hypothetical protein